MVPPASCIPPLPAVFSMSVFWFWLVVDLSMAILAGVTVAILTLGLIKLVGMLKARFSKPSSPKGQS